MICISAVINVREFPLMASSGLSCLFFFSLAALCFLLPSALVCAELATALPENGGIYTWVKSAMGKKIGFLAMWMEWINNLISFPATLSMIVTSIAYVGFPSIASNRYALFSGMMILYWGCTLINLLNLRSASRLNILGSLFGILLPTAIIILLGGVWLLMGNATSMAGNLHFLPTWHISSLVFFLSVLSSFSGMQICAFHVQNVAKPKTAFPQAIAISAVTIFVVSILASLAVAVIVPHDQLNLMNGLVEGMSGVFHRYHLSLLTPIFALFIVFGSISGLCAWMLALAKGLCNVAKHQQLPTLFAKTNQNDAPQNTLLLQAIIGSLLSCVFLFMPSLKSAFWVLIALTSQFTVLVYCLVFSSAIILRFTQPNLPRTFKIPGKNVGIITLCSLAIIVCLIGFVLGWFPPQQIDIVSYAHYIIFMIIGDICILGLPLFIFWFLEHYKSCKKRVII